MTLLRRTTTVWWVVTASSLLQAWKAAPRVERILFVQAVIDTLLAADPDNPVDSINQIVGKGNKGVQFARGVKLPTDNGGWQRIDEWHEQGWSWYQIAEALDVTYVRLLAWRKDRAIPVARLSRLDAAMAVLLTKTKGDDKDYRREKGQRDKINRDKKAQRDKLNCDEESQPVVVGIVQSV